MFSKNNQYKENSLFEIDKKSNSGVYTILDAGSAITFDSGSDLELQYTISDFSFVIRMSFEHDDERGAHFSAKIENENVIHIACFNFSNMLGNGCREAMEIGQYNNKKIYFRFWVSSLSDVDVYKIDYTLYREK